MLYFQGVKSNQVHALIQLPHFSGQFFYRYCPYLSPLILTNIMRKFLSAFCLLFISICFQAQDLKYYLPDSVTYNPAIPKPKDIIYHEVGEWHITHDRLVNYMKAIAAAAPDRVKLETMGFTYEGRPQVLLIITSPKNQRIKYTKQYFPIVLTFPNNFKLTAHEKIIIYPHFIFHFSLYTHSPGP